MAKYRKKPVVIEANQWFPFTKIEGVDYDPQAIYNEGQSKQFARIKTLEGEHIVTEGDFIITGIQGERYACKPDIFEATYEAVV